MQRDFAKEADRYEARDAIAALFEPWFAARPLQEVERTLQEHRVCWGLYRPVTDLLANDSRASDANPVFTRMQTPGVGAHLAAGNAVRATGAPSGSTGPAPLLGQHTDEVLSGVLGLDSGAIGRLHDQSIVAGPERDPTNRAQQGASVSP
jgi:2-methylfumaryl-CoA isomerase